jgi:hypothetical protein
MKSGRMPKGFWHHFVLYARNATESPVEDGFLEWEPKVQVTALSETTIIFSR